MTDAAFNLLRDYCSLMPVRGISFSSLPLSELQRFLLKLLDLPYSPSAEYQKSFWKSAISNLEQSIIEQDEIDPRILDHYLMLLSPSSLPGSELKPPTQSFTTHFWKPACEISRSAGHLWPYLPSGFLTTTLLESQTIIQSGTTGMRTWRASYLLAEYLITHSDVVQNKRVLELGSGIGFLGIVVATLHQISTSQSPIWLTDVNDDVLALCKLNLQLECNFSSLYPHVNFKRLDWSSSLDNNEPLLSAFLNEVDAEVILGADIVFDPELIPGLVGVLSNVLQPEYQRSPVALIALTVRNQETFGQFLASLHGQNLSVESLATPETPNFRRATADNFDNSNEVKILRIVSIQ